MILRNTALNWRWWLILPYCLLVCTPMVLLAWFLEFLQRYEDTLTPPLRWAIRHRK
ncbi:hypothetical protein [Dyella sp. ASV21]|uniref:hypothetical protein n=1 Tax=Dyella sp. ASV21 TaxID=2795114 RepID=UPI0018EDA250|nr:hypothetical protein [Dyella sp. ASV21]